MASKKESKKKDESDRIEIDFGTGKVGFGGLFKGIGNLIDLASKMNEEGINRQGEIKGLPDGAKGVFGISVRTLSGKPVVEAFGNVRNSTGGPAVEETWEPIVDVFDEKDHILIVAELPGVTEDKIKVEISGDILNITAVGTRRKYAKEVLLPAKAKKDSLKSSYKNGVLEVTLEKES
jgi:HSP20 family protein